MYKWNYNSVRSIKSMFYVLLKVQLVLYKPVPKIQRELIMISMPREGSQAGINNIFCK